MALNADIRIFGLAIHIIEMLITRILDIVLNLMVCRGHKEIQEQIHEIL